MSLEFSGLPEADLIKMGIVAQPEQQTTGDLIVPKPPDRIAIQQEPVEPQSNLQTRVDSIQDILGSSTSGAVKEQPSIETKSPIDTSTLAVEIPQFTFDQIKATMAQLGPDEKYSLINSLTTAQDTNPDLLHNCLAQVTSVAEQNRLALLLGEKCRSNLLRDLINFEWHSIDYNTAAAAFIVGEGIEALENISLKKPGEHLDVQAISRVIIDSFHGDAAIVPSLVGVFESLMSLKENDQDKEGRSERTNQLDKRMQEFFDCCGLDKQAMMQTWAANCAASENYHDPSSRESFSESRHFMENIGSMAAIECRRPSGLKQLNDQLTPNGYGVRIVEMNSKIALYHRVRKLNQTYNLNGNNKIKFGEIRGHGDPGRITLGRGIPGDRNGNKDKFLNNYDLAELKQLADNRGGSTGTDREQKLTEMFDNFKKCFDDDIDLILESCSTGGSDYFTDKTENVAAQASLAMDTRVTAPIKPSGPQRVRVYFQDGRIRLDQTFTVPRQKYNKGEMVHD